MTVNREQLFAELEALSEEEIEAGLEAGVWSEDRRQLVEHYLDQMKLTTMQFEAAGSAKEAAVSAGAHWRELPVRRLELECQWPASPGGAPPASWHCFSIEERLTPPDRETPDDS